MMTRLLFALSSLVLVTSDAFAVCSATGRKCIFDSQCCSGLICAPGGVCQSACRIDRLFARSGGRNPANACQSCRPGRATTSWTALADGTPCEDRDPCTAPDACRGGACASGAAVVCDDGNPCTVDACDAGSGCAHRALVCNDGNPCTDDACDRASGSCISRAGVAVCDDRNSCTDDSCDPTIGCAHSIRSGSCDDESACTTNDVCAGSICVGGAPPDCDDADPCTADTCDPALGCVHDGGPPLLPTEPGAFLVFADVLASSPAQGRHVETSLTITNVSGRSYIAHVSFLNGDRSDSKYCYECDFDVPLRARATATLVLSRVGTLTRIRDVRSGSTRTCLWSEGFVTVDVEDSTHRVSTDNVITGSQSLVDFTEGTAFTVPAVAFQGKNGNANRTFAFDGLEYRKLPAYVETDFDAPDFDGPARAELVLFTLGFRRQHPPLVDCSVIGRDLPGGHQFSNSFPFGCWTSIRLQDIDPQLAFPYLGSETGRVRLTCTVHGTEDNVEVHGGVYGILVESSGVGSVSGRLLEQSPAAGCPVTLRLGEPSRSPLSR